MRRVFVSVDMEGLTGAVSPNQVLPGRADYERFREIMLRETNAVIRGAFDGGAEGVLVNDSHDGMLNLKIEGLDGGVELISGYHKPFSMMQGIDKGFMCALFVGYHSMASGEGVLSHTMTGIVSRAHLNGVPASEGVINAMVAGHFGVPVGMIAGDQYAVSELHTVCPDARGVVVKRAIDRYSAQSESLSRVEEELRRAAKEAVHASESLKPYTPGKPITLGVEFAQSSHAARVVYAPIARRVDSRTIEIVGDDPIDVYMRFRAALGLASTARDPDYG
ncbi:MAG: M55 family metallopeptidase [Thermoprotei archaeon]